MRISKIAVHRLFGRFNHELTFNPSERITIMYGPNGIGKTMILRIIDTLFNHPLGSLGRMPFEELHVNFDDGSRLTVERIPGESSPQLVFVSSQQQQDTFTPSPQIKPQELNFPLSAIEDNLPLTQVGTSEWRDDQTGEILDLDDVLNTYGDEFPVEVVKRERIIPPWLEEIKASLPVRLIDTERLTDLSSYGRRLRHRRPYRHIAPERTVRRYSDRLGDMVQHTLTEYATLSQSLDRSFPARLVEEPTSESLSIPELSQVLANVEERRSEFVEAGLLLQEHESWSVPIVETMDASRRSVLAVYAQDAREKLGVFDDLYAKVKTFLRIANSRLLYKHVSVSQKGMKVSTSDGSDLQPEMLSSGEQHEIVLLFDLLFGTKKNSLILVDEPELSLHVAWQRAMLNDLLEMADLSDFRALLATHSPQIIGQRWDLTIQLQGPDSK